RCKRCRESRKGQRGGPGGAGPSSGGEGSRGRMGGRDSGAKAMFPAVCAECGTETLVPFKPSNDRPVLCRSCFDARKPVTVGARSGARPSHARGPRGGGGGPSPRSSSQTVQVSSDGARGR